MQLQLWTFQSLALWAVCPELSLQHFFTSAMGSSCALSAQEQENHFTQVVQPLPAIAVYPFPSMAQP